MKIRNILLILMLVLLTLSLTACSQSGKSAKNPAEKTDTSARLDKNNTTDSREQGNNASGNETSDSDTEAGVTHLPVKMDHVIRWGIPDIYRISKEALSEFNQRLADMGYDFGLEFIKLSYGNYNAALTEYEKANGSLDIAFSGLDSTNEPGKVLDFLESGYYLPLDDLLSTEEGKKLYDLYDSKLWDSVKVNDTIFTIPVGVAQDKGITFAFNKTYITEEELEGFTGDISELQLLMKNIPGKNNFSHIIYRLKDINHTIGALLECDYSNGLLLPYDTQAAVNPYEYDSFRKFIELFHTFYQAHYINYDLSILSKNDTGTNNTDKEYLKTGSFFVYIGDDVGLADIGTEVILYKTPAYIQSRPRGTGISAGSEHKEDAFRLLTLAYTDTALANLLVYGADGIDYKLKDGVAYSLEEGVQEAFTNQLFLGIYEMSYPNSEESFDIDRLHDKKSYYKNNTKASPYLGFHFRSKTDPSRINKIVTDNLDLWKSENLKAEFDRVNRELRDAGIDALIAEANEQLAEKR